MSPALATALPALLKVLADPTRLRILALLELEELSVGELGRTLGMAQSRVSNHLRVLREVDLLHERHAGTSTFLRAALSGPADALTDAAPVATRLWFAVRADVGELPEHAADLLRLEEVLASRVHDSREFFDQVAGRWDQLGGGFRTGQARQRAVASLLPDGLVLADLGCGTGYVSRALVGLASRLICVDRSRGMLDEARRRLAPLCADTTVELREGELDALPLADDEVDGAVAAMVLHHLPELDGPLREMHRAIRPGGTAVVLELAPHREAWMHTELGDRHLGLDPSLVTAALARVGFVDVRLEPVEDGYRPRPPQVNGDDAAPALTVYIVRGRVPADADDDRARPANP